MCSKQSAVERLSQLREKLANAGLSQNPQVVSELVRRSATRAAVPALQNILLTAAAGGAGIAALQRFARMRKEQDAAKKDQADGSIRVYKSANEGSGPVTNISNRLAEVLSDIAKGQFAQKPYHLPWFPTAAAATAGGGLAGGYLLADRGLFKPLERESQKSELEKARQEYQQALEASLTSKNASQDSRCKLAVAFDKMDTAITDGGGKLSYDDGAAMARFGSTMLGLYMLAMGGAGLGGTYKGYKDRTRTSKTRAAEQAVLERRLMNRPKVRPVVVPLTKQKAVAPAEQADSDEDTENAIA